MIPRASESASYEVISTGLPQLDRITGISGIPFKRITEISGTWSVGKTTLALQIVASAQEQGIECIWFDAEWAWDDRYAQKVGVATQQLGLIQKRVAEDGLDEILAYVEEGKETLIVIDAIGALHPRDEAEKDSGGRTIGAQAGLVARFCRKTVPMLALNNNALIVLNHEYEDVIKAMPGRPAPIKTSGGRKLEYHKSLWIRLTKTGMNVKQGERIVGFEVEAEIRKNKMAATQKEKCQMQLLFDKGFNPTSDLVRDALEKGVLVRTGNTFWIGKEKIGTKKKLDEWLKNNAERVKKELIG